MEHVVVIVRNAAEGLHVYLPALLAVEASGHEMCPSVLSHQAALGHSYAALFGEQVVDVLYLSEMLRVAQLLVGHSVQLEQPVVESFGRRDLPAAHLARLVVIGDNGLCPLSSGRCSHADDVHECVCRLCEVRL